VTFVVEPLKSALSQDFHLSLETRYVIAAFLPYLYLYNSPDGIFSFAVLKDGEMVYSHAFNSVDIKLSLSTTNNYAHVYYPIIPTRPVVLEKGSYIARLTASNYEATNTKFLGWIRASENVSSILTMPPNSLSYPLSMRIKTLNQGILI
jgi:hypothetical protein